MSTLVGWEERSFGSRCSLRTSILVGCSVNHNPPTPSPPGCRMRLKINNLDCRWAEECASGGKNRVSAEAGAKLKVESSKWEKSGKEVTTPIGSGQAPVTEEPPRPGRGKRRALREFSVESLQLAIPERARRGRGDGVGESMRGGRVRNRGQGGRRGRRGVCG
jgi:hypothetical protein